MTEQTQESAASQGAAASQDSDQVQEAAQQNAAVQAFPQLAEVASMDDDQRAQAFTSVLDQLHHKLDDVTGR